MTELTHRYGDRTALSGCSLSVNRGEVFALLGPNGSGKTTLFRILSTLVAPQRGCVEILGRNLTDRFHEIRHRIGVVFQSPSLDRKLTVRENFACQAALYGLSGSDYHDRETLLLEQLGLADRARDLTETLSGGLRRRAEIGKSMLHRPELLLMDEPSTGLDPGARGDMWRYLEALRDRFGVTIVLTTHILEEVERADRIAILNEGQLVALDTPQNLRDSVGNDSITIETPYPNQLVQLIRDRFDVEAKLVDGDVRIEQADGHHWISKLVESFSDQIRAIRLGKPTLEDVFIARTGHRFWQHVEQEQRLGK